MSEVSVPLDILEKYGPGVAPAGSPALPWLERLRAGARARTATTGLPTPRRE